MKFLAAALCLVTVLEITSAFFMLPFQRQFGFNQFMTPSLRQPWTGLARSFQTPTTFLSQASPNVFSQAFQPGGVFQQSPQTANNPFNTMIASNLINNALDSPLRRNTGFRRSLSPMRNVMMQMPTTAGQVAGQYVNTGGVPTVTNVGPTVPVGQTVPVTTVVQQPGAVSMVGQQQAVPQNLLGIVGNVVSGILGGSGTSTAGATDPFGGLINGILGVGGNALSSLLPGLLSSIIGGIFPQGNTGTTTGGQGGFNIGTILQLLGQGGGENGGLFGVGGEGSGIFGGGENGNLLGALLGGGGGLLGGNRASAPGMGGGVSNSLLAALLAGGGGSSDNLAQAQTISSLLGVNGASAAGGVNSGLLAALVGGGGSDNLAQAGALSSLFGGNRAMAAGGGNTGLLTTLLAAGGGDGLGGSSDNLAGVALASALAGGSGTSRGVLSNPGFRTLQANPGGTFLQNPGVGQANTGLMNLLRAQQTSSALEGLFESPARNGTTG